MEGIFQVKKTKQLEKTGFIPFLCIGRSRNGMFPFVERAVSLSTSTGLKAKSSNQRNEYVFQLPYAGWIGHQHYVK